VRLRYILTSKPSTGAKSVEGSPARVNSSEGWMLLTNTSRPNLGHHESLECLHIIVLYVVEWNVATTGPRVSVLDVAERNAAIMVPLGMTTKSSIIAHRSPS
jgi:hypothetical protein